MEGGSEKEICQRGRGREGGEEGGRESNEISSQTERKGRAGSTLPPLHSLIIHSNFKARTSSR